MQLAYLFHRYAKSLLSTDGRIADCTVRHPGVERPFPSFLLVYRNFYIGLVLFYGFCGQSCNFYFPLLHCSRPYVCTVNKSVTIEYYTD